MATQARRTLAAVDSRHRRCKDAADAARPPVRRIAMPAAARLSCRALAALLGSLLILAVHSAPAGAKDATGCGDISDIPRYAGSTILGCEVRPFDELTLATDVLEPNASGEWTPRSTEQREGRIARNLYVAATGRTVLEVYRNYEASLSKLGVETIFACASDECGGSDGRIASFLYPPGRRIDTSDATRFAFNVPAETRYLSARIDRPDGELGLSLLIARETGSPIADTQNRVLILLEVAEPAAMEERMVLVKAEEMASALASEGRFLSYGILFDTDSSALKPESDAQLQEIAKLMQQDGTMRLYVVGHTDNVGGADYNMRLSRARAESVTDALAKRFNVSPSRLKPEGVGLLAPVASNDTDEGRAKNRRVELVKQ
jgi:outer membrane protein OmpA-like peptidoglycan-associated protein